MRFPVVFLVIGILGIVTLHGADLPAITVYPRPAVAGLESELRLPHDLGGEFQGTLRINAPDGTQEEHPVKLVDGGGAFFRWRPRITGYHQLELKGEGFVPAKVTVPVVWRRIHFYSWVVPTELEQLASYPRLARLALSLRVMEPSMSNADAWALFLWPLSGIGNVATSLCKSQPKRLSKPWLAIGKRGWTKEPTAFGWMRLEHTLTKRHCVAWLSFARF